LGALLLAACAPQGGQRTASETEPVLVTRQALATPQEAPAGTCWDRTATPAVIETVSQRELIEPAKVSSDGRIQTPARYRSTQTQKIVQPRQTHWIELVCADQMTPDFVASLQRALAARGFYAGEATGRMDAATKEAVVRLQAATAEPVTDLTISTARAMGLVAVAQTASL
jgi:hypothetical protein